MNENTQDQASAAAANALPGAEAKPKLTHAEKLVKRATMLKTRIEADTAEYTEIVNEINAAEAMKNLAVGSVIQVKMGRKFADKDTTRIVEATIMGVQDHEDGGRLFKIMYGEGFDAEVASITPGSVVAVGPVAA